MNVAYETTEPTRSEIDRLQEPLMVEFGTPWCGHCIAAQPLIATAFASHPGIRHIRVEDGKGRPLGRSFQIKLWPTLVFLREGREVARLVRPTDAGSISRALDSLMAPGDVQAK